MIERSQARLSGLLKVKDSFTAITAAWAHPLIRVKYVQNVSPEVIALWLSVDLIQLYWQNLTVRVPLKKRKNKEKAPDPEFSSSSCNEECL